MFARALSLAAVALVAGACSKDASTAKSEPGVGEPAPATPSAAGGGTSGGVAAPSPAAAAPTGGSAVIVGRTGFYKTASKDARVPDPSGKGQVSNWIDLLHRGETVTVHATSGDWTEIEVSGGTRGFVPSSAVLGGDAIGASTVQEGIVTFDRPDPVAVSKTRLDPGALLFVVSKKDRFAEVNVRAGKTAWVLADQLDATPDEVQVARMIEKARYLLEKEKGAGTKELLEVANANFARAKLLPALTALISGPAPTATSTATP